MTSSSSPTPITLGVFTPSVLLAVAERTGALADAGLDVATRPVTSSPAQFTSLREGELDIALTSPDNVLAYRFSPTNPLGELLDTSIVGSVDRGMGLGLYGRPGVTEPDQLRGAVVGVDVPSSGFALALYALADSLGVGRDDYRLDKLGSTPRRLEALVEGRCDATMLNAGNELLAEAAGCHLLARVTDVCSPYLGTVVAVLGDTHLPEARRLAAALAATATRVVAGELDEEAAAAAGEVLGLPEELAGRYTERLKDPAEGLTPDGVDLEALATLVAMRRRWLPEEVEGRDPLDGALDPERGLVAADPDGDRA